MKKLMLLFAVLGFIIPYSMLIMFIVEHGFDIPLLINQIFASYGSAFFALDVILTALAIIYLSLKDTKLAAKRHYVICAAILVGPSCALPLYILFRNENNH